MISLIKLVERLTWAPPRLSPISQIFEDIEIYGYFLGLVDDYLPEDKPKILALPYDKRSSEFIALFSEKYFPLFETWDEDEGYRFLCSRMPIQTYGYCTESSYPGEYKLPFELLLSLVEDPVETENAHLNWLKGCPLDEINEEKGWVLPDPADLERVKPKRGEELHPMLDGTKYAFLAEFADWVWANTGNMLLDWDDCNGGEMPEWDREEVEGGAEEWKEAKAFFERQDKFLEWFETDIRAHYHELVEVTNQQQLALEGI